MPPRAVLRLVAQACPTLCDPRDCSLPGSSVHGILQARIPVATPKPPYIKGSVMEEKTEWNKTVELTNEG